MTIPGKQAKLAIPSPAATFSNGNESTVVGRQKNIRRGKENTKYHRISIKKEQIMEQWKYHGGSTT